MTDRERRMSGFDESQNPLETLGIGVPGLAENSARQRARQRAVVSAATDAPNCSELGAALSIREVATMLGCSPWTVRQQHLPRGLPHFRSGPNGKLIFFRDQVVAWILTQQKKGGKP